MTRITRFRPPETGTGNAGNDTQISLFPDPSPNGVSDVSGSPGVGVLHTPPGNRKPETGRSQQPETTHTLTERHAVRPEPETGNRKTQTTGNAIPSIAELSAIRARIEGTIDGRNGMAYLQRNQGNADALKLGKHTLEEIILKEYLPAIRQWRDRSPQQELEDMAKTYANKATDLEGYDGFWETLDEYMVAEDIANDALLGDLLERVDMWSGNR